MLFLLGGADFGDAGLVFDGLVFYFLFGGGDLGESDSLGERSCVIFQFWPGFPGVIRFTMFGRNQTMQIDGKFVGFPCL